MTALATVYAAGPAPSDPGALSTYLLQREHEHWAEIHERAGRDTTPETMARAVSWPTALGYRLALRLIAAGPVCGAAGRRDVAFKAIRDAAVLWERIHQRGYRLEFLKALTELAAAHEAPLPVRLDAGEWAAKGFGSMWRRDITVLPPLVSAQRAWAAALSEAGAHDQALEQIGKARNNCARLRLQNEARFALLEAGVLLTYARCCWKAHRQLDQALDAARAAEVIHRERGSSSAAAAATARRGAVALTIGANQATGAVLDGPSGLLNPYVEIHRATTGRIMLIAAIGWILGAAVAALALVGVRRRFRRHAGPRKAIVAGLTAFGLALVSPVVVLTTITLATQNLYPTSAPWEPYTFWGARAAANLGVIITLIAICSAVASVPNFDIRRRRSALIQG